MSVKKNVEEALTDAGIFTAVSLALKKATTAAGEKIGTGLGEMGRKHLDKLQQRRERQRLFLALQKMPWDKKQNIIGLLKTEREAHNENHIVRVLATVPSMSKGALVAALEYLNDHLPASAVTEAEEGAILLELLDDNGAQQMGEKLWDEAKAVGRKLRDDYAPEAGRLTKEATTKLGPAGDSAAKTIGALAGWFERHGGR